MEFKEIGNTETITDNLNPIFVRSIMVEYRFEEVQELKVEVYHVDNFDPKVSVKQTLIGYADFKLHQVTMNKGQELVLPLTNGTAEYLGEVSIRCSEQCEGKTMLHKFFIEGHDFKPKHIFYKLCRIFDGGDDHPVFESETATKDKNDRKHRFLETKIMSNVLLQNNESRKAIIEFFRWLYLYIIYRSEDGKHTSLGRKDFYISEFLQGTQIIFPTGTVHIKGNGQEEVHPFLDFIYSGLDITLLVAIDFTQSNEMPNEPSSLHYFDEKSNQYLQAISQVVKILENYSSDKSYPVLGFGARMPWVLNETSHCFALNGDIFHPKVKEIGGIMGGNSFLLY